MKKLITIFIISIIALSGNVVNAQGEIGLDKTEYQEGEDVVLSIVKVSAGKLYLQLKETNQNEALIYVKAGGSITVISYVEFEEGEFSKDVSMTNIDVGKYLLYISENSSFPEGNGELDKPLTAKLGFEVVETIEETTPEVELNFSLIGIVSALIIIPISIKKLKR